jgi:type II restriction enzyme
MTLGFEETQIPYTSGAQRARAWTERWVRDQLYCPNCGTERISQFETNRPVADFLCTACNEEYELKVKKPNLD